jgi:hypothetical protein
MSILEKLQKVQSLIQKMNKLQEKKGIRKVSNQETQILAADQKLAIIPATINIRTNEATANHQELAIIPVRDNPRLITREKSISRSCTDLWGILISKALARKPSEPVISIPVNPTINIRTNEATANHQESAIIPVRDNLRLITRELITREKSISRSCTDLWGICKAFARQRRLC